MRPPIRTAFIRSGCAALLLAVLAVPAAAASDMTRFKAQNSIVAFTTEPNDLGSTKDFLQKFPETRCAGMFLDAEHMLYLCENGSRPVQKFYFNFEYGDNTVVLDGVSLNGEKPNLGRSLQRLMKLLD